MIARLAALRFLLAALLVAPAAEAQTRRETVAGWQIETGGSGDGGHVVRLLRRGRGYRLEHNLEFWRGNGGVVVSAVFRRGRCSTGDGSAIVPFEHGMGRELFDRRLVDYLRQCPVPAAEEAMLRRTLNAAWPRFAARAAAALAAIQAENEAIARHGQQP